MTHHEFLGDALTSAPLGPPPLCTYPRGFFEQWTPSIGVMLTEAQRAMAPVLETIPPDWFLLSRYYAFGVVGAQHHGFPHPRTWREAVEAATVALSDDDRAAAVARYLEGLETCGLDPDSAPPADLDELARWCEEWAFGKGRFADGQEYGYLTTEATAADCYEDFPAAMREFLNAQYQEEGSPWGTTETAAWLWYGKHLRDREEVKADAGRS